MPAIAATLVRRQKRMRIYLQARQHSLTLRGNLRFPWLCSPEPTLTGSVTEVMDKSSDADQLRNVVDQLQSLLYPA
jgi:hypothetical protein